VDALLVGGVGGTGTPYYPVPSTVTTLPLAPSSTLNPGVVPWSSIPVPPDFDPATPGTALYTIPSRDVVEYPETLAPDFIIPPVTTTVTAVRGVRVGLRCKRLDYDVTPQEHEVALGVATGILALQDRTLAASSGVYSITGMAAGLGKVPPLPAASGSFSITGNSATLFLFPLRMSANAGVFAVTGNAASLKWPILPSAITYTQSSLYVGTTAASAANMSNGSVSDTATGTDSGPSEFVRMTLPRTTPISKVFIGTATNSIPGGWDKSYTENRIVEYSTNNGSSWVSGFNTGTFVSNGIYEFAVSWSNVTDIRIRQATTGYLALTEFYAV
jgi:hypothetical protein